MDGGPRYRGDIEGLRAVAVLAVILFHAGVPPFGGGFLGVDIFFTLSGFLITGILLREMAEGHFSLWAFWRRRVARIVPALLFVTLCVLAAWLVMAFPSELATLRGSGVAAPLFLSNLFFWRNNPYFAPLSEVQPLLHSWSLGVEEQFYLLYPLLLLVPLRGRYKRTALIAAASIASLALAAAFAAAKPSAAFYLLPARFWELGLGGLAAAGLVPAPRGRRVRALLAALALVLLLLSIVFGGAWVSPFPAALPPTVATAILLVAAEGSAAGRLLAIAPMRAIGRLSYSLYLWHWPILAFWRLFVRFELTPGTQVLLIALSFALAAFSFFAVERPLRRRLRKGPPLPVLAGGALACLATAGLAYAAIHHPPHVRRLPPAVARILAVPHKLRIPVDPYDPSCRPAGIPRQTTCLRIVPGRRNVLLAGDSHAAQYWTALVERFPDIHFLVSMRTACRPKGGSIGGGGRCDRRALEALDLARKEHVDGVILASRWWPDEAEKLRPVVAGLRAAGIDVLVVGPVVEYQPSVPELLARSMLAHDRRIYDDGRVPARERLDRAMAAIVRGAGGRYFSAYRAECPPARPCFMLTATGQPIHFDYGHLTPDAAEEIVAMMPRP
ncbi:MAG TPA: acyltransferase family protein [Allosphingosinicella sp.]|nr:acyltransferase family protein [Allosphingosinicella sp.]